MSGALSIPACAAGSYSERASPNCTVCANNTWAEASSGSCRPCPALSDGPGGTGESGCRCRAGTARAGGGAVTPLRCDPCAPGFFAQSVHSAACQPCPAGSYSDAAATQCALCPAGTYQAVSTGSGNLSACLACPLGLQTSPGASACANCPAGFFCPGAGIQLPCPLGAYSVLLNLWSEYQCPACPAGSYCPDSSTKLACPLHTSSASGSVSKLNCTCDPGYRCVYKRAVRVVVTLPLTQEQFQMVKGEFTQAVADAAGVTNNKVTIISVTPQLPPSRRRNLRRLLRALPPLPAEEEEKEESRGFMHIQVLVRDVHGVNTGRLHHHLLRRGLPRPHRVRVHAHHDVRVGPAS